MKLSETKLILFFTGGVGLKTWAEVGNLDRETAVYKELNNKLSSISFVTYGGIEDRRHSNLIGDIGCYPIPWSQYAFINVLRLLLNHWKVLKGSDVLKTNQILGAQIPVLIKKLLGKKLIVRCGYLHSRFSELEGGGEKNVASSKTAERRAFEAADIGVVPTKSDLEWVIKTHGISREKLRVIPNYVDVNTFAPAETRRDAQFDLVFVGRSGRQKNIELLFTALTILKSRGRKTSLLLIGGCSKDEKLKSMAKAQELEVTFRGNVSNKQLPDYLSRAEIFILPSLYEGHPKSLIEAMSCGMPCIGTEVEGIRELIDHGETGYLCRTDAENMADVIEVVLSDGALRSKLGKSARRYVVENLSLDRVLEMELDVIREVVSR